MADLHCVPNTGQEEEEKELHARWEDALDAFEAAFTEKDLQRMQTIGAQLEGLNAILQEGAYRQRLTLVHQNIVQVSELRNDLRKSAQAAESAILTATTDEIAKNATTYLNSDATAATAEALSRNLPAILSSLIRRKPYFIPCKIACRLCVVKKLTGAGTMHHLDECMFWNERGLRCGNCGMLGHSRLNKGKRCQRKAWAKLGDEILAEGELRNPYAQREAAQPAQPAQPMQQ